MEHAALSVGVETPSWHDDAPSAGWAHHLWYPPRGKDRRRRGGGEVWPVARHAAQTGQMCACGRTWRTPYPHKSTVCRHSHSVRNLGTPSHPSVRQSSRTQQRTG